MRWANTLRGDFAGGAAEQSAATVRSAGDSRVRVGEAGSDAARSEGGACLDEALVLAFSESRTSEAERCRIDRHLDICPACVELVCWAAGALDVPDDASDIPVCAMTFAKGSLVMDRYKILRFVDRGGMGEVYEAFDRTLGERVALKTVVCTAGDSPVAVQRLSREVRLARRIGHRNVCRTYELHEQRGVAGDQPPLNFITMEFIDGQKLGHQLRGSALAQSDAIDVGRQLLAGLEAAHAAGILHLDFKSDNVMLRSGTARPEAVIMDFGLSRALDTEALLRTSELRQLAGSAGYMSPEQVECRPDLGKTSDIYSFGVVLFEMLTGRLPFEGDSPTSVMLKRLKERPPTPSSLTPGLTPELDAFVLQCLSRDPQHRFPDATRALAAFERAASAPSRRARPPARRWLTWGALAAGVGMLSLWVAAREERPKPLDRSALTETPGAPPQSSVAPLEPRAQRSPATLDAPVVEKPIDEPGGAVTAPATSPAPLGSAPIAARPAPAVSKPQTQRADPAGALAPVEYPDTLALPAPSPPAPSPAEPSTTVEPTSEVGTDPAPNKPSRREWVIRSAPTKVL